MTEHYEHFSIRREIATGKVLIRRAKQCRATGQWEFFGELKPEELPIEECKIGTDVLVRVPKGYNRGAVYLHTKDDGTHSIRIPLEPSEPPPLIGIEFLWSLPVGSQWIIGSLGPMTICENGIHWRSGTVYLWDGGGTTIHGDMLPFDWRDDESLQSACADTVVLQVVG